MAELFFTKTPQGYLAPADAEATEYMQKKKVGSILVATIKQPRNPKFHRKLFALLHWAYQNYEVDPLTHKGVPVNMPIERFRHDLTIMAGFFTIVANLNGELRKQADSLSYSDCSQAKAEQIYSAMLDVIATNLFGNAYSVEELDRITNEWLSFT